MKSKATEYTIIEDKFQMPEYTTFQRVKGLVSYSKFSFKKMDFLMKPTVLAAIHNPSFLSIYIAASVTYARKIGVHLCWRLLMQKVDLQTQRANTRIDIQGVPVDLTC